jgi:hypothetical protein
MYFTDPAEAQDAACHLISSGCQAEIYEREKRRFSNPRRLSFAEHVRQHPQRTMLSHKDYLLDLYNSDGALHHCERLAARCDSDVNLAAAELGKRFQPAYYKITRLGASGNTVIHGPSAVIFRKATRSHHRSKIHTVSLDSSCGPTNVGLA